MNPFQHASLMEDCVEASHSVPIESPFQEHSLEESHNDTCSNANKPRDAILVRTSDVSKSFPLNKLRNNTDEECDKKELFSTKYSHLSVVFSSKQAREDIQCFIRSKLTALIDDIEEVTIKTDMTNEVYISFSNIFVAKRASDILRCYKRISYVEMMIAIDLKAMKDKYESEIVYYLDKQDQKIKTLETHLLKLKPRKQYMPIDEHKRILEETEALKLKIEECLKHKEEFRSYMQSQLAQLSSIMKESFLHNVESNLNRECNRLTTAFPIYARRSEIVETVTQNQVTVLVGETGSGKSTQVVQYLFEAGLAKMGVIVCTQPRKVAAITLAKHVSKEMNVKLGEELGYKVGMNEKCGKNTRIMYVTDHMLLNECIVDSNLSKYSCILIDEAHERSINTDMLLAFIKKSLKSRRELKLVIMSATIEPELFVNYFKEDFIEEQQPIAVSTVSVSGRTFPVDVEYDPLHCCEPLSASSDYVMNAVEVARNIHSKQPPGDILVFLTCAPEIEKACRAMDHLYNEVVVLPLHGKLPPDEQQKVFDDSGSRRKIIFSTNVAETSVTIPGVKYVVDSGLAKEMQFDSRKNMDTLEVRLISKSSAEQRKGRAGRVSAGKCYRLYTAEDYNSKMPDRTKPEILRIQLSQVVLKMLEFGVPNVLTFDFVEHPDRVALVGAIETLISLGAIDNNQLTALGKKMAVLPLQPQLSKILLEGVKIGVGTEALLSVALSSLAGQVFFRGGSDDMKEKSDQSKLTFCHQLGDQITSLSVYKCWKEQDRNQQKRWCLDNFVNAKSMRIVKETITELNHILKRQLKISLDLNLDSLEAAECYLGKLYFDAFINNLAVYLGHSRAGYMANSLPCDSGSFLVFPGSSLHQLGCTPKYIIYERTLKTSCQFLTQVFHVKPEWVDEAVIEGRLPEDPAVKFADYMVLPLHAALTGPKILRELKFKSKELVQMVNVSCGQSSIPSVFDFSPEPVKWGVIRALSQKKYHPAVQSAVTEMIEELQVKFQKETSEFGLTKEDDWTKAVIGKGGKVEQMIMPYQFRTVIAVCSNVKESPEYITSLMKDYGEVKKMKLIKRDHGEFRLSITYSNASQAQRAIKEFNSSGVHIYPHKGQQFTVRLQWERRQRGTHANLSFDSPQNCDAAFASLHFGVMHLGKRIKVAEDKYSRAKLFLTGEVLSYCDEASLKLELGDRIATSFQLKMGYRKYDDHFPHHKSEIRKPRVPLNEDDSNDDTASEESDDETLTSEENIDEFRQNTEEYIRDIIAQYAKYGTFSVKFLVPREWDIFFTAFVTFDDPDEGYRVLSSHLDQMYIYEKIIHASPSLKCMLAFKQEIYTKIHEHLDKVKRDLLHRYPKLIYTKVIPPDNKVRDVTRISLTAHDVKAFSIAQNEFYKAVQPCKLNCNTIELQEYILSKDCQTELEETQTSTSTYIYRDLNAMVINIYGTNTNQMAAKAIIEEKASELFSDGAYVSDISLRGEGRPAGVMKHLVTRYGFDLNGMLELEGVRRVTLNPHYQSVSVLATVKGHEEVIKCVNKGSSQAVVRKIEGEYAFDCSACLSPIDDPNDIFRLECCGHAFHIDCMEVQLKPDTLTLPVQCAMDGCSKEFVLRDFKNFQERSKSFRMPVLVSAALQNFMKTNTNTYKNCPTPDCRMIYTQTTSSREFICSSCFVSTCSKCHQQYHAGISCEVYEASRKNKEEIQQWLEEDPQNHKICPKCSAPIEKNGGCQHVACICGAHICWRCMKYFKKSDQCYVHQPHCPALTPPPSPVRPVHNAPPVIIPAPPLQPVHHQAAHTLPVIIPAPPQPLPQAHTPLIARVPPATGPIRPLQNRATAPPTAGRRYQARPVNGPANRTNDSSCVIL